MSKDREIWKKTVAMRGRYSELVDASLRRHYPDQVIRVFLSNAGLAFDSKPHKHL